jgi:hypothetical protein
MKNQFIFLLSFFAVGLAFATKMPMPSDKPKIYEDECASCHMAYPPGLLSESSWQNLMNDLNKHFGVDASLNEKESREITNWLIRNGAAKKKYSELAPENRITKTTWFIRKHDEVRPDVWKRPSIKSPSNCVACHSNASDGIFSDKNVKIPLK